MDERPDEYFDLPSYPLDPESEHDHELIELLAGDLHCPLCGSPYGRDEARLIRQRDSRITLAVQCHCCGTGSLITITSAHDSHVPHTIYSELTPAERRIFNSLPPVSGEDVRRVRELLRSHTGDLFDLLDM
jgi:hypothetical protein